MLSDVGARDLLLRLLEVRELRITRTALFDYHGAAGQHLLESGLLETAGYETSIIATEEEYPEIYTIGRHPTGIELGYHSAARGWVQVPQEDLEVINPGLRGSSPPFSAMIFACPGRVTWRLNLPSSGKSAR